MVSSWPKLKEPNPSLYDILVPKHGLRSSFCAFCAVCGIFFNFYSVAYQNQILFTNHSRLYTVRKKGTNADNGVVPMSKVLKCTSESTTIFVPFFLRV